MSLLLQILTIIPVVVMFTTLDAKQARFYAQTFQLITKQWMGVLKVHRNDDELFSSSRMKKALIVEENLKSDHDAKYVNKDIEQIERNFNNIVDRSIIVGIKQ
ncbi:hypothetical protein FDP41_005381 [Naegleria fowleri]|uniref:Uncharacterized protein n=1 Tax=Naegleria fowleri TaxID=5763 RepID=A0A6A5BEA7_NAEFO|nr:uncharacterized protein FDP41_005381 [Naegleria fowleri]KAF0975387.1 hypothetical protein FDP41_005381 [Naegleria fowleri]CAG4710494.1 unnamed protein product [Naegleria fowleri]